MTKKPHKYADNGVALDTVLSITDLKAICAQAAIESTGDLWNGTTKLVVAESGDTWIRYHIPGALRLLKLMTFIVKMGTAGGRSTLETEIEDYYTTQTTVMYLIPVTPKKMVARHGYVQFINKVANTVRQADPSARIAISEGEWMPAPKLPAADTGFVAVEPAAAQVPAPGASAAPVALAEPQLAPVALAEPVPHLPVFADPALVSAAVVAEAVAPGPADEATQKVQRRSRLQRWTVSPQGMTPVPLATPIVIGRAPVDAGGAYLLTVPRSEDTVSKSHARLEVVNGAVVVTDLGSNNGTILVGPEENLIECEPNVATAVPAGYVIELGDFVVTVEPEGSAR